MGKHSMNIKGSLRKKILASLAVLTVTGVVGVGATMSALTDSATTNVTVDAGTINLQTNTGGVDSKSTPLYFNVDEWYPGATDSKTFKLKNKGTLPINVNLVTTASGGTTGLASKLTTTITNTTSVYVVLSPKGTLMRSATFSNLRINAGQEVTLKVDVVWTSGADDNNWAGKTDTVTYTFNAVNATP